MDTDSYSLVVPEADLRAAAYSVAARCRRASPEHLDSCISLLVNRLICPCVSSVPCIVDALVQEVRESIVSHDSPSR